MHFCHQQGICRESAQVVPADLFVFQAIDFAAHIVYFGKDFVALLGNVPFVVFRQQAGFFAVLHVFVQMLQFGLFFSNKVIKL
jgi:hypothetical protein